MLKARKVGVRNGRPVLFLAECYPAAEEVAEALDRAFPWDETPEGCGFWLNVYDRLKALAKGVMPMVKGG